MVNLIQQEKSLSGEEFDGFERKFSRSLPESFKKYYKNNNGGYPSEKTLESGKWGLPVNGFNSIKYGDVPIEILVDQGGDISPHNTKFGAWRKLEYVPFAYDSGGNSIFLSLREEDYGVVYLYAIDGDNIFEISDTFERFLEKLFVM